MEGFCTQCGARTGHDDAFCPQCGTAAQSAPVPVPASVSVPASTPIPTPVARRRWPYWIVLVLFAFLAGWYLGQHHGPPPHPPTCGTGSGGGGGGGAGGGGGRLGAGGGGAGAGGPIPSGGTNPIVGGNGGGSLSGGGGGDGDVPPLGGGGGSLEADGSIKKGNQRYQNNGEAGDDDGGGKGKISGEGTDDNGPSGKVHFDDDGQDIAKRLAGGKLRPGSLDDKDGPDDPGVKEYVARDFTYDRTGLPRYGDSVRGVVSALSEYPTRPNAIASSSAIVTDSSFQTVVDWYRTHLPAGWRNQTIGDFQQLANALSPQAIASALGMSSPQQNAAAAPPLPRLQISMYFPPAGTPGDLGVMIVQPEGKPVTVLMKTRRE